MDYYFNIQIKKTLVFLVCAYLSLASLSVNAQNTVSPYSIYGPGEIQNKGFSTNQGMGGAGIALKSGSYINNLNPASYVGMDSLRIISEFGIAGKLYNLSSRKSSQGGFTGNLSHIGLGFKYTPWLAGSFGVVPFSTVNYTIVKDSYVGGTEEVFESVYTGSGGISQFYFGNAVRLGKHFSLGANISYMFGSLVQEEQIASTNLVPNIQVDRFDYLRSVYFDFGAQMEFNINDKQILGGVTFAPKQDLNSKHVINIYDYSYSLIGTDEYSTDYLTIPDIIGVGLGLVKPGTYKAALDYTFQSWSGIDYPMQDGDFEDLHRVIFGMELTPWEQRAVNPFYKNWTYRFGLSYERSYLKLGNSSIDKKALSLGVGIPLPGRISSVNISLNGGVSGTQASNLVKEKFLTLNLGFSLNEMAFIRRKFE